jgi:hypothetical protein
MKQSITQIRGWLPTQTIVIGEWGSQTPDVLVDWVAHGQACTQDTTTAAIPAWWDNGGSFGLFKKKHALPRRRAGSLDSSA